jgi:putative two-component system response regulator
MERALRSTKTAREENGSAKVRSAPKRQATILLVGDDERGIEREALRTDRYRLLGARSDVEVFNTLKCGQVDLVILAAEDPVELEWCRRIKADHKTELVPVLAITSDQVSSQIDALGAGADDFLCRPVHPELARTRIRALLRHKAVTDRLEQTEGILFALAQAVEQRDQATAGHCQRLSLFSLALGLKLGLLEDDLQALYRGGYLHDIGKVGLPDKILLKPGPLDEQEWETMRTHPTRGEDICRPLRSLEKVLPIIRHHHERWDGSGYPDGLKGEQIPLLARVLQIADIYDALTSERPYKNAVPGKEALGIMQQETDRGWRDPELMGLFLRLQRDEFSSDTWRDAASVQQSLRNLQEHLMEA